jgi:glycosyltransferase involved in cell wall biosynthesis
MTNSQIFINGRFLAQPVTGVQRYAHELFRHVDLILQETGPDVRLICLAPPESKNLPDWKRIEVRRVGVNIGNLWEQIDLPIAARGNFLFSPTNIGPILYSNQAVTLHDASIFAVPQAYTRTFRAKYALTFRSLVRIAKLILTDSVFSQRELSHYLGVPASRFKVIPLGGDHLNAIPADSSTLQRHGLAKHSYIFSVASQSSHKNFSSLLEAARQLENGLQFAAAGGSYGTVFQKSVAQSVPTNVRMLGYINDHELKALYENALAFIFPSTYEGFGLPVLEAMNCGCPVLCSKAASLPEVAGPAALYFDPMDVNEISDLIVKLQSDPGLQGDLSRRGREQAAGFSWMKTARETLAALLTCL